MERHAIDDRIYTATPKGGKVSSLALFYGKAVSVAENLPTVFLGQDNFSYGRNSDSKTHLLKKTPDDILSHLYGTNGWKREGIEMKMLRRFDLRFDCSTTKQ